MMSEEEYKEIVHQGYMKCLWAALNQFKHPFDLLAIPECQAQKEATWAEVETILTQPRAS